MNLFSPVLKLFGVGNLSNPDTGKQTNSINSGSDSGISVSDERAMQTSAVWACVQYITNSVCSLPLNFYKDTPSGRKELTDHYLNDLFHRSPNALMKPRDFRKAMTFQLALWSNAYAEITWIGDRPVSLVPLRPGRMTPYIGQDGILVYHYQMDQGVRVYSKKSILHLKGFGADGVAGLDRVNSAKQTLGLSVSADIYAAKQFANGGRSGGGYLMFDEFLTTEQRDNAKKIYEGMSETAYNKGKVWILEGGVKYEADGLNPDTMQMLETRKMQLGEIARFFGVPEVMIGAGGGGTSAWPASFEQQLLSFLTFTLQDYLDEWESAIKDSLLIGKRNIYADHDVTGFIKMDSQARANLQATWAQNGVKTRNELRKMNNDQSVDGGDDLTVQVNLVPIDKLGEPTEASKPIPVEDNNALMVAKIDGLKQDFNKKFDNLTEKPQFTPNNTVIFEKGAITAPDINNNYEFTQKAQKMPDQLAPIVQVDNVVNVPETIIENVNNIKVDVPDQPIPDVIVNNELPKTEKRKDKKVTFKRDRSGDITEANLKDG